MNVEGAPSPDPESLGDSKSPESSGTSPEQEGPKITPPEIGTQGEGKEQEDKAKPEQQIQKAESILGAFGSGLAEGGKKEWQGLTKTGEKLRSLLRKETLTGTRDKIRNNPDLVWKTIAPIIGAAGLRTAAKFGIRQLVGAPGWGIAIGFGALSGGMRAYKAKGAEQKAELESYKQEIRTLKAKKISESLSEEEKLALSEKQKHFKAKCAERWGSAVYGGARGGLIAGVSYWAAGKIFEHFSHGQHTIAAETRSHAFPAESHQVSESNNYSGGILEPDKALNTALHVKPDLGSTLGYLQHGDTKATVDAFIDHGIDPDAGGEFGQHHLVGELQKIAAQDSFKNLSPDGQQSVVYEIMSYPEHFNNDTAINSLIENAQENFKPGNLDIGRFVKDIHHDPEVQKLYLEHLARAIDKDTVKDTGEVIQAVKDYAASHNHLDLGKYRLYPEIDDKRTIQDLINTPRETLALKKETGFEKNLAWLKKNYGPVTAGVLTLGIIAAGAWLKGYKGARSKAETSPGGYPEKKEAKLEYKIDRLVNSEEIKKFVVSEDFPKNQKYEEQIRSIADWLSKKRWDKEFTVDHIEPLPNKDKLYQDWDWERAEEIYGALMKYKQEIEAKPQISQKGEEPIMQEEKIQEEKTGGVKEEQPKEQEIKIAEKPEEEINDESPTEQDETKLQKPKFSKGEGIIAHLIEGDKEFVIIDDPEWDDEQKEYYYPVSTKTEYNTTDSSETTTTEMVIESEITKKTKEKNE